MVGHRRSRRYTHLAMAALVLGICLAAVPGSTAKQKVVLATQAEGTGNTIIEEGIIAAFEREHNLEVEIIAFAPSAYVDKVVSLVVGGTPPDVLYNRADLNLTFVGTGIVQPLTPFMSNDRSFSLQDFFPAMLRAMTLDGHLYGIPRGNQPTVMFYNSTAFKEAGVQLPDPRWSWEGEFLQAAKRLTIDKNGDGQVDQWGMLDQGNWWWAAVWSYGGAFLDENERQFAMNRPAGVTALRFAAALTQEHGVAPGRLLVPGGPRNAFYEGLGAMVPSDAVGSANLRQLNPGFEWDVTELPQGPAGRATLLNGAGYSIAAGAPNPELGWQLIKALTSEYGIEQLTLAYDVGQVVPTRRSVAQGKAFLKADPPPQNRAVFLKALDYARIPFVGKQKWPELNRTLNPAIAAILSGRSAPEQALGGIAATIQAILQ